MQRTIIEVPSRNTSGKAQIVYIELCRVRVTITIVDARMFLRKWLPKGKRQEADVLREALFKQKPGKIHVSQSSSDNIIRVSFGITVLRLGLTEISMAQHVFAPFQFCFLVTLDLDNMSLKEAEEKWLAKVLETQTGLVTFSLRYAFRIGVYGSFIPIVFRLTNVEHNRLVSLMLLNYWISYKNIEKELSLCSLIIPKLKRLGKLHLGFGCSVGKAEVVPSLKSAFYRLYDHKEISVKTYYCGKNFNGGIDRNPNDNFMNLVELERIGLKSSP